ncbi:MAG: hypothetical protein AAGD35_15830 [Actinomycetota bacterium]
MNIEDYLEKVTLIDCTGQVTHELILQIDGRVKVQMGQLDAIVDPTTRQLQPGNRQLGRGEYGHEQVIDVACTLARGG